MNKLTNVFKLLKTSFIVSFLKTQEINLSNIDKLFIESALFNHLAITFPSVYIIKPNNIILSKIISCLNFN